MRTSTEQDYNAESREIEFCIDIYFNGLLASPLKVTRGNYLIDVDLLDEACADGDTFIGVPSANEVSFNLFSEDGIFNPNNTHGTYYNKIKIGIPLHVYVRPVDEEDPYNWDSLGIFYVTDWNTDITGINVSVTGTDSLQKLFNSDKVKLPIKRDYSIEYLIRDFFLYNNISIITRGLFNQILPFAYIDKENNKFLQEIALGALAFIYNDHSGNTVVQALDTASEVLWELTDHDQIIRINAKQSLVNSYDGITVICEQPQLSEEINVLQNRAQEIEGNATLSINSQGFTYTPLYALSHVEVQSDADCEVKDVSASVYDISYKLQNLLNLDSTVDVSFFGYIVEKIPMTLSDNTSAMLKIDNDYIQTKAYAERVKNLLTAYIRLAIPVLEIDTRGNPKYQPGDKVRIYSEKYNVDFTGWLIRQQFKYDGGLRCTITVLNSGIIGG